jgi:hypothetical protein
MVFANFGGNGPYCQRKSVSRSCSNGPASPIIVTAILIVSSGASTRPNKAESRK